jgi:hypothetical protein
MNYTGKLYGKVGSNYVPLHATSEDYDNLIQAAQASYDFMKSVGKEKSLVGLQVKATLEQATKQSNGKMERKYQY